MKKFKRNKKDGKLWWYIEQCTKTDCCNFGEGILISDDRRHVAYGFPHHSCSLCKHFIRIDNYKKKGK